MMVEQLPDLPTQPVDTQNQWSPNTYLVSAEGLENTHHQVVDEYSKQLVMTALQESAASTDTPEQKSAETEVLTNGTLGGHPVGMAELSRNASNALSDRVWMAKVIHKAPEVAKTIAEREIAGFHCTGSFALAGLVEGGALLSGAELDRTGKHTISGAHDAAKGMSQISFGSLSYTQQNFEQYGGSDKKMTSEEVEEQLTKEIAESEALSREFPEGTKLNVSMRHIADNFRAALESFKDDPDSLGATMMRNKFPVAIGITRAFVKAAEERREKSSLHFGQSYYGEFRPAAETIPIEALPVIAVPADKVESVQKLLARFNHEQVAVVPIEALKVDNE